MPTLVPALQTQLSGPGRDDGGAGTEACPHDHLALGAAVYRGVRQALESLARCGGRSWRVDETYIKVRGQWDYLYRAVDKAGQTIDFRLSRTRDVAAAKAFFSKAVRHQGRPPHTITLDGYAASHRAVRELQDTGLLPKRTKLRSSKYLNNMIEQDHRGIKSRTRPMLGFKNFTSAVTVIDGIELLRRIHKRQFALGRLRHQGQTAPALWNAVLAA